MLSVTLGRVPERRSPLARLGERVKPLRAVARDVPYRWPDATSQWLFACAFILELCRQTWARPTLDGALA
ncbi:hypothetical protein CGRA01v4_05952 [Colletotrichum graminicola]|nr:hypothetical protein CGRA01v4_05952 [Colletotrichum graminicola]